MALIEATAAAVGTTASYFPQHGATCGLFHHLPEIVSKNGDTIV
jgi:hypothetical protein